MEHKMIPNTTQVPNYILDDLMPRLKDVEFRVLLIIVRQTLGWIEDKETGRRKEKDWISVGQFEKKTGCERWAIGRALSSLYKHGIIEAMTGDGKILETAKERQQAAEKIYFRLKTKEPTLFDGQGGTGNSNKGTGKTRSGYGKFHPPGISPTTKETGNTKETLTKESSAQSAPRITPEEFFDNQELHTKIVEWLGSKGVQPSAAQQELKKFISYWTEPNKSGSKVRWQGERYFDIRRRLGTWFANAKKFEGGARQTARGITMTF